MNTIIKSMVFLLALLSTPVNAADALSGEMKELVALLPGTYHNSLQFDAQSNMGLPASERLGRRTQFFAQVERPKSCCVGFTAGPEAAFFYMQIYRDGEHWMGGEHIVVVYPDRKEKTLVWQFLRIAEPEGFVNLHRDIDKQRNVKLIPQPQDVLDCPVLGRKAGPNLFKAELKNGGCNVVSRVSGKVRRLEMNLTLSPAALVYLDRGIENGVVVHGSTDATPFSMNRVAR